MPDHTTTSAALYLKECGYTVRSKRDGTDQAPNATTIKQWCERGKIRARKAGWVWLIDQQELDALITRRVRDADQDTNAGQTVTEDTTGEGQEGTRKG